MSSGYFLRSARRVLTRLSRSLGPDSSRASFRSTPRKTSDGTTWVRFLAEALGPLFRDAGYPKITSMGKCGLTSQQRSRVVLVLVDLFEGKGVLSHVCFSTLAAKLVYTSSE